MKEKRIHSICRKSVAIAASLLIASGLIPIREAHAADTVFTQKGSGNLGWHATPYGGSFTESQMQANTDWIASNYKEYGYQYICVDGWVGDSTKHNADGYITYYKNDWQHDWKWWADYVHSKGLKLGIYYNPSWLHQDLANDPTLKVVGTNIPLKNIVREDPNNKYMHQTRYMVDPDAAGSKEYVQGMIKYYISIGVDLLKIDFLRYYEDVYGHAAMKKLYDWMREAAGNDIILYYANTNNVNHAVDEVATADFLRASEDWRTDTTQPGVWYHTSLRNRGKVKDNSWPPAYNIFDGFVWFSDLSGPGKVVLDGDFSVLSSGGTDAEKKTRISLLAMAGSSINIGDRYSNIGNNDVYYKNWEIIDMNKRGFVGKPLVRDVTNPQSQIWKGQLSDGTWVVALFNREDTPQVRSINFANQLGIQGNYLVSDMWSHSALGEMSAYSEAIEPHGVRLLKISSISMEPYGSVFFGTQHVVLHATDPGAVIRYTTDGSEPTATSPLYQGGIDIHQSATLRAKIMSGTGQGQIAQAMFLASATDPIDNIAAGITAMPTIAKGQTSVVLPSVPSGYTVRIKNSDQTSVIDTNGTIHAPSLDTSVKLVLEVARTSDGVKKDTGSITVVVPGTDPGSGAGNPVILEGESMPYVLSPSGLGTKFNNEAAASGGRNFQITFTATTGQSVNFTGDVPQAGKYEVVFGYKKNNARGIFQMYIDGTPVGDPVDQFSNTAEYASASLGQVSLTSGAHQFRFDIVGKNPAMTKTLDFVIDNVKLVPEVVSPSIISIPATAISTVLNERPELPAEVEAVYSDDSHRNVAVTWDAINPARYSTLGSFTVEGAVYGTTIPAIANVTVLEVDPQVIADGITSIPAPAPNATELTLPSVPEGYSIAIQQTYNPSVINASGVIYPPATATAVDLVLEVTRNSDGESADTDLITVIVPARSGGGEEGGGPGGQPGDGDTGTEGNSGNTGNTGSGSSTPPSTLPASHDRYLVSESALSSPTQGGKLIVSTPNDAKEIVLPAQIASKLGDHPLEIHVGNVSMELHPDLIRQISGMLHAAEQSSDSVVIQLLNTDSSLSGGNGSHGNLKPASSVYEVGVSLLDANGKITQVKQFEHPLTIRIKADASRNAKLLGIYDLAEQGRFAYVESIYVNGEVTAEISHPGQYAIFELKANYADLPSEHWALEDIQVLAARHIIDSDVSSFEPNRPVTRAEFTAMLVRALRLPVSGGQQQFADVSPDAWYAAPIMAAVKQGIINGKSESQFDPNVTISREEMSVMLMRAYTLVHGEDHAAPTDTTSSQFRDEADIEAWALPAVRLATSLQLLQGRAQDQFSPKENATRAEAAVTVSRILNIE
ncbi:S-layer homology domain-containing protein [Paenibacillus whitsoniae]|uniref:SLH domain-containing protein n=1 Tax=Paenibacillus whitsoniae TaxID=2496558 RepID=A0A430J8A6_9BACL|nr:S-layer homology domain-containing protein [Paenibacillus whitsoniae]RTE06304.1 hypothetical protein EJQ19_23310 [Paenibacillus whitsoniae]